MSDDEVKELAEKLGAFSFGGGWEQVPLSVYMQDEDLEALARVALDYVEKRRKEQAEKLLTAEFVPWETGALPVPLPLYVRGIVCSICHKEVTLKYDEETQSYIARENCDCIKEQP